MDGERFSLNGHSSNGHLLSAIRHELSSEPHIRYLLIDIDCTSTAIRLTGLVPNYYMKQLAQTVVLKLLNRMKSDQQVQNEIRVE